MYSIENIFEKCRYVFKRIEEYNNKTVNIKQLAVANISSKGIIKKLR